MGEYKDELTKVAASSKQIQQQSLKSSLVDSTKMKDAMSIVLVNGKERPNLNTLTTPAIVNSSFAGKATVQQSNFIHFHQSSSSN
mmetsp:Transcript_32837/g.50171  ORF Transcript_32837/g.50171 Transcript_32837/m.50171 type:complete len:85 (-) Transcript_32837:525-779(-)